MTVVSPTESLLAVLIYLPRETGGTALLLFFLKPMCYPAEFKFLGVGRHGTPRPSRLPSFSPACHTGIRTDLRLVHNSSEAQMTVEKEIASRPVLPGRSCNCNFPGGLQITASGTSDRKIWSLGNRNLMGVSKRNELAASSRDLPKRNTG